MASINAERAVYALLESAGYCVYTVLPSDLESYPVVQIQTAGGSRNGVLALERLVVAVISDKRRTSSETANDIHDMLIDTHHVIPGHGLIDSIQSESIPVEVPHKDNLIKNIFTIAAYSRSL